MSEFEDLTSRLKALGDNPVPPPVATSHLMAMAEVAAPRAGFAHKVRVAAAFGIGILVGGTGLGYAAAEGHLPDAAQNGLSVAAEKVGVELPRGDEKKAEKADNEGNGGDNSSKPLDETVPCDKVNGMTHGEYVSANVKAARDAGVKGNASALAKSDCGKDAADDDADLEEAPETEDDAEDDGDGEGKAKGAAKKAENAPDAADPAGPPAERPGNTPASVPVSDDADESADENTPEEVPPAGTGPGWDDDTNSED